MRNSPIASSRTERSVVREKGLQPSPFGRPGESIGDLRELTKPIEEPPELAAEAPIYVSSGSGTKPVAEPVDGEGDFSVTIKDESRNTHPTMNASGRQDIHEHASDSYEVVVGQRKRRPPLQIESIDVSPGESTESSMEISRSLPLSAAPSTAPSSEPDDGVSPSSQLSDRALYSSARRRRSTSSTTDLSDAIESAGGHPTDQPPDRKPVLFNQAMPAISTQVIGPREIVIGQEAAYDLVLRNNSQADAQGIHVEVKIPDSAEVIATEASNGLAQRSGEGGLEWQIEHLKDGETETLHMSVIPRSSAPLAIGVALRIAPLIQETTVMVQEPKLEIGLQGPDDVLYGETKVYRIQVSNPGTGPANNVVLQLIPPGSADAQQSNHVVGILPAGATETFEVELVPREAGKLAIRASATADGDLVAQCEKNVFVRQPSLVIETQGLDTTYAGTTAKYIFCVRNDGTADAKDVLFTIELPKNAELIQASEGYQENETSRSIQWDLGTIPAGKDFFHQLHCVVREPGNNQVVATAETADKSLHVQASHQTQVIALADLKLHISDPSGPVAVGDEAIYEIRVQNRGSNLAKNVQIVALFSEGIEPVGVEGSQYTVHNGRVAFQPIESLAPDHDVALRIRAVASTEGTHIFRAEVLCSELGTKLSSEETTRYFVADLVPNRQHATAQRPKDTSSH